MKSKFANMLALGLALITLSCATTSSIEKERSRAIARLDLPAERDRALDVLAWISLANDGNFSKAAQWVGQRSRRPVGAAAAVAAMVFEGQGQLGAEMVAWIDALRSNDADMRALAVIRLIDLAGYIPAGKARKEVIELAGRVRGPLLFEATELIGMLGRKKAQPFVLRVASHDHPLPRSTFVDTKRWPKPGAFRSIRRQGERYQLDNARSALVTVEADIPPSSQGTWVRIDAKHPFRVWVQDRLLATRDPIRGQPSESIRFWLPPDPTPQVLAVELAALHGQAQLRFDTLTDGYISEKRDADPTALQLLGRAEFALARGHLEAARIIATKLEKSTPNWMAARLLALRVREREGRPTAELTGALKGSEHAAAMRRLLGSAQSDPKLAHQLLDKLKGSSHPRNALARFKYFQDRDWPALAGQALDEALQLAPQACEPAMKALRFRWSRLKYNSQVKARQLLPSHCLSSDAAKAVIARFFGEQGRLKEALALLPKAAPYKAERLRLLERLGETERLVSEASDFSFQSPMVFDSLLNLSQVAAANNKFRLAEESLKKATGLPRGDVDTRLRLKLLTKDRHWERFAPNLAKIRSARIPKELISGRSALLLLDHHVTTRYQDGSSIHHVHQVIRVLSPEAIDHFGEGHLPEGAQLLQAATIKADGRVLIPEDIIQKDSISFPQVAVGDDLNLEYIYIGRVDPNLHGGWIENAFYFGLYDIPSWFANYVVLLQDGVEGDWDSRGRMPPPKAIKMNGFHGWQWRYGPTPASQMEALTPSPLSSLLRVPVWSSMGWPEVLGSLRESLLSLLAPDERMRELVSLLAPTDGAQKEGAIALFEYVRDHITEDPGSSMDIPAWKSIATGRGERAVALLGLLLTAKFNARLAWVNPIHRHHPSQQVPDLRDFSYAVVHLRIGVEELWLDPTFKTGRPGFLPPTIRGCSAFLVGPKGITGPVTTPRESQTPEFRDLSIKIEVSKEGVLSGSWTEKSTGMQALSFRERLRRLEPKQQEQALGGLIQDVLPGATVQKVTVKHLRSSSQALEINMRFSLQPAGQITQSPLLIGLSPTHMLQRWIHLKTRTKALYVDRFEVMRLTLDIRLADGLKWRSDVPQELSRSYGFGSYTRTALQSPQHLRVIRELQMSTQIVLPDEYPRFMEYCRSVDEADRLRLQIETND